MNKIIVNKPVLNFVAAGYVGGDEIASYVWDDLPARTQKALIGMRFVKVIIENPKIVCAKKTLKIKNRVYKFGETIQKHIWQRVPFKNKKILQTLGAVVEK